LAAALAFALNFLALQSETSMISSQADAILPGENHRAAFRPAKYVEPAIGGDLIRPRVRLYFRDNSNIYWTRYPDGRLVEQKEPP
jgi:hypothetical protein